MTTLLQQLTRPAVLFPLPVPSQAMPLAFLCIMFVIRLCFHHIMFQKPTDHQVICPLHAISLPYYTTMFMT
jgi:hypothetical protein